MKKVGILTFHCADNYGAMLQAFGLKTHLQELGLEPEIINYCPPYMTGRHWWIPYVPMHGLGRTLRYSCFLTKRNLTQRKALSRQKKSMKKFRTAYLCGKQRKKYFLPQLKRLRYDAYVLGSDQIWNPALTYGLRPAYFGAFACRTAPRPTVISYAASFGGSRIDETFHDKLASYLDELDAVSIRETDALSFVHALCRKDAVALPDPVFLPHPDVWRSLIKRPADFTLPHYIFYYETEERQDLRNYAMRLSIEKKLPICELRYRRPTQPITDHVIYSAGPSEFLALLSDADYVVTNSFHAICFSIIFEKQFAAFPHSDRSSRLCSVLLAHGLESRIGGNSNEVEMDAPIDWTIVRERTRCLRKQGSDFLVKYLNSNKDEAYHE